MFVDKLLAEKEVCFVEVVTVVNDMRPLCILSFKSVLFQFKDFTTEVPLKGRLQMFMHLCSTYMYIEPYS